MKRIVVACLMASGLIMASANAEVVDSGPGGFSLVHEVTIAAARGDVWRAAIDDVGLWWSSDHSISGDASNMSIDARPLGCFCESLGGRAGVVHMTVTFVNPLVLLRLTGGLGPLGLMGVDGNMLWEFDDSGEHTIVRFSYVVGGYRPGGLDAIAEPVDAVIGNALQRLRAHVEVGSADMADQRD